MVENAGWTLVPIEATSEMKKAGESWSGLPGQTWTDMLDAAPEPPLPNVAVTEKQIDAAMEEYDRKMSHYRGNGGVRKNERRIIASVIQAARATKESKP